MNRIKYIVTLTSTGVEAIVIFPAHMNHNELIAGDRIISAGYIQMNYHKDALGNIIVEPKCYGDSFTLKIGSRPEEDSLLAEIMFRKNH